MDTHVETHATHELGLTRRIPAPPARVFAAWIEPEQVRQWWGPYGMTTPVCEVDPRPGGIHRTVMRDPVGKEYPNLGVIDAIEAPHRLVMRVPEEAGGPFTGATSSIGFTAEAEGTRLDVRWRHPTPEMRAAHEAMGFEKGWGETLDRLTAHVLRPPPGAPMPVAPAPEHGWLHRLLGDWSYAAECAGPPGGAPMRATGTERVRSLGGFWVVGEGEGECPAGGQARMVITMGWDAAARRFRGTWIGSMMPHMFLYEGALEADGRTLTLEAEGPSFTGEGRARYRDVVEMRSNDHRIVTSEVQGEDGGWTVLMRAEYRRQG